MRKTCGQLVDGLRTTTQLDTLVMHRLVNPATVAAHNYPAYSPIDHQLSPQFYAAYTTLLTEEDG